MRQMSTTKRRNSPKLRVKRAAPMPGATSMPWTDVRGGVLKRAEWREFVRNRKSVLAVQCDTVEVRFYGEAAVVTGEWTYTMTRPEGKVTSHSRWTSVWTKYTDGWKRHVFQNTYVNPDADKCATRSRR
jgi:ketosteroid isomerase-like protein